MQCQETTLGKWPPKARCQHILALSSNFEPTQQLPASSGHGGAISNRWFREATRLGMGNLHLSELQYGLKSRHWDANAFYFQ